MLGVFLAAAGLGAAYNALSPLGVRFATGTAPVAFAPAPSQAAEVGRDPALQNETLTAAILTGGPALARGEIVLVDGRDDAAFEAGHIPGAVSLPLRSLSEMAAAFSTKYAKAKPLVTYCGSVGCPIAHVLAEQLRRLRLHRRAGDAGRLCGMADGGGTKVVLRFSASNRQIPCRPLPHPNALTS